MVTCRVIFREGSQMAAYRLGFRLETRTGMGNVCSTWTFQSATSQMSTVMTTTTRYDFTFSHTAVSPGRHLFVGGG